MNNILKAKVSRRVWSHTTISKPICKLSINCILEEEKEKGGEREGRRGEEEEERRRKKKGGGRNDGKAKEYTYTCAMESSVKMSYRIVWLIFFGFLNNSWVRVLNSLPSLDPARTKQINIR